MDEQGIDALAKIIYQYLHIHQELVKSDLILVFTSNDLRVAEYAAKLYKDGWAPMIVFSGNHPHGGNDDLRAMQWGMPEAEKFREVALAHDVPDEKIIVENKSTNTGENAKFSYNLLKERNMLPGSIILLQKPYMERRTWTSFKKQWPDPTTQAMVSSPPISYEDYPMENISKDLFINIMVGDVQKIIEYPRLGFQIEQDVPPEVLEAYHQLRALGFTKSML